MARVLSFVHAISMTCSLCWTILCAACLYNIARPDSQFLCTHVYDFLWPEVQSHSNDSHNLCMKLFHVLHVYSLRLAPQCRAFSSCSTLDKSDRGFCDSTLYTKSLTFPPPPTLHPPSLLHPHSFIHWCQRYRSKFIVTQKNKDLAT